MERKEKSVNNTFYDELNEQWLGNNEHPIGLLVAENKVRTPWVIETIAKHYSTPCSVLDIGCGGGLLTNPLALKGHDVVGIDLSQKSLDFAAQQDSTKKATYLHASAEDLPFVSEQFDVTCAMDLLEHVQNPHRVIEEAARVTKKGGLFFFHTFNRNLLSYLLVIKGVEWFVKNTPKDMHLYSHFIKPNELTSFCKASNLEVQYLKGLSPDPKKWSFWKTACTRKVADTFPFYFCNNLLTGYVGIAKKIT